MVVIDRFASGKEPRYPLNRRLGGGPIAGLDMFKDEEIPDRYSNSGPSSLSPSVSNGRVQYN
jgi:hypothetical protein